MKREDAVRLLESLLRVPLTDEEKKAFRARRLRVEKARRNALGKLVKKLAKAR